MTWTASAAQRDLAQLWRQRASMHAHETALFEAAATISFLELEIWSDGVAIALRETGVAACDVVAIIGDRGAKAVAAILAVAKCGATYVPLESHVPAARRAAILQESRPRAVIVVHSPQDIEEQFAASAPVPTIVVPPREAIGRMARARAHWPDYPQDIPLYLLYTSGSSGAPQGVIGTQQGLLNRLEWMWRAFPFTASERAAHRTPLGFVDSVQEIWGPLLQGVPLVVVPSAVLADIDEFISLVASARVTRLVLVPSLLRAVMACGRPLAQEWQELRYCVTSGEALPAALALQFGSALPACRLLNLYGMTEAAADATWHEVIPQVPYETVPIGRPIGATRCALLDERLQEVAPGDTGGIYIGGPGLALGYHQRAARTALSFIPDPSPDHAGERLYWTGDYGSYNCSGELEYRGRKDNQVKVRGHRIELSEVERHARAHPAVSDCAALVSESMDEDVQLFASLHPLMELTAAGMKAFLAQRLPAYMIPSFVHVRNELPRLPNGKLDRRALSLTVHSGGRSSRAPLATQAQTTVAMIWQELLRSAAPGPDSNFLDLGGNSLKAALAVTRLRAAFGVTLGVAEFLDCPDLAQLARLLELRAARRRVLQHDGPAAAPVELADF